MVTIRGKDVDVQKTLCDLIELDFDAIEAYQAAVDRLEDFMVQQQLRAFMADHERHVRELSEIVRGQGGEPPTKGDFKRVLTKGKVVIGNLVGDRGILMAMKSNEDDTNQAYEQAVRRHDLTTEVREVLQRNLSDERRHRAWIEDRLSQG
ncbi:MAG: PA2169 family four-helix-bundle protein, partial [Planctomycetes bacterium]|nr:PA2169 family four-helix-bundle protein [Planctomycetota bacterium]